MRGLFSEQCDASKAGLVLKARKLDLAAHAAWLYYIAGNTQEEIATKLNVSRQAAQRLVALAVSEKIDQISARFGSWFTSVYSSS